MTTKKRAGGQEMTAFEEHRREAREHYQRTYVSAQLSTLLGLDSGAVVLGKVDEPMPEIPLSRQERIALEALRLLVERGEIS